MSTIETIDRLQQCITDINDWMSANGLKVNMDKTELLWAGSGHVLLQKGGFFFCSLLLTLFIQVSMSE